MSSTFQFDDEEDDEIEEFNSGGTMLSFLNNTTEPESQNDALPDTEPESQCFENASQLSTQRSSVESEEIVTWKPPPENEEQEETQLENDTAEQSPEKVEEPIETNQEPQEEVEEEATQLNYDTQDNTVPETTTQKESGSEVDAQEEEHSIDMDVDKAPTTRSEVDAQEEEHSIDMDVDEAPTTPQNTIPDEEAALEIENTADVTPKCSSTPEAELDDQTFEMDKKACCVLVKDLDADSQHFRSQQAEMSDLLARANIAEDTLGDMSINFHIDMHKRIMFYAKSRRNLSMIDE